MVAIADVRLNRGIDVNDVRATLAGFDDPLEAHGVVLRHVGPHDQDGVRIHEIAGRRRRAAAAE